MAKKKKTKNKNNKYFIEVIFLIAIGISIGLIIGLIMPKYINKQCVYSNYGSKPLFNSSDTRVVRPELELPQNKDTRTLSIILEDAEEESVYVFDEPSLNGEVLGMVYPGRTYKIYNEEGGWYSIILDDGEVVWISEQYVEINEN